MVDTYVQAWLYYTTLYKSFDDVTASLDVFISAHAIFCVRHLLRSLYQLAHFEADGMTLRAVHVLSLKQCLEEQEVLGSFFRSLDGFASLQSVLLSKN